MKKFFLISYGSFLHLYLYIIVYIANFTNTRENAILLLTLFYFLLLISHFIIIIATKNLILLSFLLPHYFLGVYNTISQTLINLIILFLIGIIFSFIHSLKTIPKKIF
jgi:hypothetical protein